MTLLKVTGGVADLEIRHAVKLDCSGDGDAATAAAVHAEEIQARIGFQHE